MAPTPLTVLTPVPLWWSLWVRFTWLVAAVARGGVQRRLRDLSFIHFAHWSLVRRWPRDATVSPDEAAPRTLVFLTNFDGSDIQYIEAFVRVVPDQIEALYRGARGFPGRAGSGRWRSTSPITATGSTTSTPRIRRRRRPRSARRCCSTACSRTSSGASPTSTTSASRASGRRS